MSGEKAPGKGGRRFSSALREFLGNEAAGGLVLMVAAGLALALANSGFGPTYFAALSVPVGGLSILHWINDGLMAVFFLLVGLEIKRELVVGQLRTWPDRVLPGISALGGMLVPALIYVSWNANSPPTLRGWAIPSATDIAFALGVLSLLGPRVPVSLKLFLTALAILDDLGAILIIALFYAADISAIMLAAAGATVLGLVGLNWRKVNRLSLYLLLGALLWFFVLQSGVHATIAGVVLALAIPIRGTDSRAASPLVRLEHAIQPWVAFLVVPVFGFANAGVSFGGMDAASMLAPVPLGIALGLFLGKQIGVFSFAWAAIRLRIAQMPPHATWTQLYGVALLCGIGFTMSLFIGLLSFPHSESLQAQVKLGVLAGSLMSALIGSLLLRSAARQPDDGPTPS
ncbi:MAG: Na+/H+ antiporter NhaA [Bauldia sp.]